MTEKELYKELGVLTRSKPQWEVSIPYTASLLTHNSCRIKAKALWLLGEMGLAYPQAIGVYVSAIAAFVDNPEPLLRERAANALGRIGRGRFQHVEPYLEKMFRLASDKDANVRLAFIWASENIATNTPDAYRDRMALFAGLLHDPNDRVRMEAPEMFRVVGKRRPQFVEPYVELLKRLAATDTNRIVRIHSQGALRAIQKRTSN